MVEGEYQRAFAIMKLDEDYSNQKNVTLEMDSAYLHEYIHFIQDFGTRYGVNESVYKLSKYLEMIIQMQTNNYYGYLKLTDEADFVSSLFVSAAGDFEEDISDKVCHIVNKIEVQDVTEYYEEDYPEYIDLFKPSVIVQYNDEKSAFCAVERRKSGFCDRYAHYKLGYGRLHNAIVFAIERTFSSRFEKFRRVGGHVFGT